MRFNPAEELDNEKAHRIIREIIAEGSLILSNHVKERMRERGYSTHDIGHILLNGKIVRKEFNTDANNWVYTLNGNDLEGDDGSVVAAIIGRMKSLVITVLG